MSTKYTVIPTQKLINLQVRGCNLEKSVPPPLAFSRLFIPTKLLHSNHRNNSEVDALEATSGQDPTLSGL